MKKKLSIILLLMLAAVFVFSACAGAGGPSGVVQKYLEAVKKADINGIIECMEPETAEMIKGFMEMAKGQEGADEDMFSDLVPGLNAEMEKENISIDYKIVNEKVKGDEAEVTVEMTVTKDGESEKQDMGFACVNKNGNWYISDVDEG